jgi:transglutaminase-like putative cysteine protease/tetratricopeptide (TPR) repeat protein
MSAAMPALSTLVLPALLAAAAPAPAPWEHAPLSAEPRAVLAAADALPPPKGPLDVLLEEATYRLDPRGAATLVHRIVLRPRTADAARAVARVERPWSPWYQARPEIRARVVTPDGEVHPLDPATLSEAGLGGDGRELYSDRRVLAGPLPAVREGAIVEVETTIRDTAPLFEAGTTHTFWFGQSSPVRHARLRIEAPPGAPLRWVARGLDVRPRDAVEGGVRVLAFERRDLAAVEPPEPFGPPEAPPGPYVAFGTGRSWAEVAERYGALADGRLDLAALAPIARDAAGAHPSLPEAAIALTAWLHRTVRYTGLELGEAEIVPATTRDVVARRFGDCKDLSLLLAGLLRAAGFDARVALLRTRFGEVDPELAGLGGFDHAIVVVPGRVPLWIDPTDPRTPPGRLPPPDQGRLALVTGPGARGLVRTPEATPDDNRLTVARELRLADAGPGNLLETRTTTGALAAAERGTPAEERRAMGERYGKEVLQAEALDGPEVTGDADPAAPLVVRTGWRRTPTILTEDDAARIPVYPHEVFSALPPPLTGIDDKGGPPPSRHTDVVLVQPYRAEFVYRLVPPDGFRPRPVPADRTLRFGPASYEERFAAGPDGVVTATFRFDTGARRLPAADAEALGREIRRLVAAEPPRIAFERTGAALLAAGRFQEAIAETRALAARHPDAAPHRIRLALALLRMGFATEAAAEARAAAANGPDQGWAYRVLGWILEHDVVGRRYGPGFDRAGAIAAYRKAKALEPSHAAGRAALADLLARDAAGARFAPGAALADAIAEYRALHDELGTTAHDGAWVAALLAAGRDAEALERARAMPEGDERSGLVVAATAAHDGAPAAVAEADRLAPEDGRKALQRAAALLVRRRAYPAAATLLEAAARGAPNAAELRGQADALARVRTWESLRGEGDERTRLVRRVAVATLVAADPAKELAELAAERHRAEAERLARAGVLPDVERQGGDDPLPRPVMADLLVARLEVAADGDDRIGWRIRVRVPAGNGTRSAALYAVRERGELRLVAGDPPVLADEARVRLAGGDLAAARRWLDWAVEEVAPGTDDGSPAAILARLWTRSEAGDAARIRRATAALCAFGRGAPAVLPELEAARTAAADAGERRALDGAILGALRGAGRDEDALRLARSLLAADPGSRPAFLVEAAALRKLGRAREIPAAAEAVLARVPDDPDVLSVVAVGQLEAGDLEAAVRTWRRAVVAGRATPMIYNDAAWLLLYREPVAPEALEWARRGVEDEGRTNEASLNTLAAAYAASGRPAEARDVLLESMSVGGMRPLADSDWLVHGWIAEDLGLLDAARAAYARVARPAESDPAGPWALAQRRLAALGKAREPGDRR